MSLGVRAGGTRGRLKGKSGVAWTYDTLTPNLIALGPKIVVALKAGMELVASDMQTLMRSNAPWQDQTGAARDGLTGEAFGDGIKQGVNLYHKVSYGIWLEVRWSGAYAIIIPTIEAYDPMQAIDNILQIAVES